MDIHGDTNKQRWFSPRKACGVFQCVCFWLLFFCSEFHLFSLSLSLSLALKICRAIITMKRNLHSERHLKYQILSPFCHLLSRISPLIFRLCISASHFLTLPFTFLLISFCLREHFFHLAIQKLVSLVRKRCQHLSLKTVFSFTFFLHRTKLC